LLPKYIVTDRRINIGGPLDEQTLESRIRANVWEPLYLPYRFDACP
jgi:hypothetical protein